MIPFYSEHNQVYPTLWNGRGAVEKHFRRTEDWARERDIYRALRLPHPDLLDVRPGVLVTAYCCCPTLLEELDAQEQTGFCAAPWESLSEWLSVCSDLLGLLPAAGNLRSFLWDARQGTVLGIDFESFRPMSPSGSAALLIAALLEHTPADTPVKQQTASLLAARLRVSEADIADARSRFRQSRRSHRVRPLSGIILAGGHSSRMGRDKAGLMLGGKPLLARQIHKMQALGIRDILLSGSIRAHFPDTRVIPDELPERGPLGGICSCLRAAKHDRCLVLSVDTPLIPLSALSHLCRSHHGDITVLRHGDRQEPLVGVYSRSVADAAAALIAEQSAPVRALESTAAWSVFDYAGPEEFLMNCNTPEDFSQIQAIRQAYQAVRIML